MFGSPGGENAKTAYSSSSQSPLASPARHHRMEQLNCLVAELETLGHENMELIDRIDAESARNDALEARVEALQTTSTTLRHSLQLAEQHAANRARELDDAHATISELQRRLCAAEDDHGQLIRAQLALTKSQAMLDAYARPTVDMCTQTESCSTSQTSLPSLAASESDSDTTRPPALTCADPPSDTRTSKLSQSSETLPTPSTASLVHIDIPRTLVRTASNLHRTTDDNSCTGSDFDSDSETDSSVAPLKPVSSIDLSQFRQKREAVVPILNLSSLQADPPMSESTRATRDTRNIAPEVEASAKVSLPPLNSAPNRYMAADRPRGRIRKPSICENRERLVTRGAWADRFPTYKNGRMQRRFIQYLPAKKEFSWGRNPSELTATISVTYIAKVVPGSVAPQFWHGTGGSPVVTRPHLSFLLVLTNGQSLAFTAATRETFLAFFNELHRDVLEKSSAEAKKEWWASFTPGKLLWFTVTRRLKHITQARRMKLGKYVLAKVASEGGATPRELGASPRMNLRQMSARLTTAILQSPRIG
ncbi:hemolysin secretion protein D, plasmid [Carpediemonas membranifera]|uniref:Hemolysin secretion protein D, plasmid n=1 Tax=Carpediemonas membranifera TaxID=201153 RepID=A0A8J6EAV2_9EUKA|nr:hemolysin secretion protein D, plasmid [Carpediemonas membranifera]|eukprot:KAG9395455.1 hemolysin secretion protein D, plasmid [Carpediemonas membranifera]